MTGTICVPYLTPICRAHMWEGHPHLPPGATTCNRLVTLNCVFMDSPLMIGSSEGCLVWSRIWGTDVVLGLNCVVKTCSTWTPTNKQQLNVTLVHYYMLQYVLFDSFTTHLEMGISLYYGLIHKSRVDHVGLGRFRCLTLTWVGRLIPLVTVTQFGPSQMLTMLYVAMVSEHTDSNQCNMKWQLNFAYEIICSTHAEEFYTHYLHFIWHRHTHNIFSQQWTRVLSMEVARGIHKAFSCYNVYCLVSSILHLCGLWLTHIRWLFWNGTHKVTLPDKKAPRQPAKHGRF